MSFPFALFPNKPKGKFFIPERLTQESKGIAISNFAVNQCFSRRGRRKGDPHIFQSLSHLFRKALSLAIAIALVELQQKLILEMSP